MVMVTLLCLYVCACVLTFGGSAERQKTRNSWVGHCGNNFFLISISFRSRWFRRLRSIPNSHFKWSSTKMKFVQISFVVILIASLFDRIRPQQIPIELNLSNKNLNNLNNLLVVRDRIYLTGENQLISLNETNFDIIEQVRYGPVYDSINCKYFPREERTQPSQSANASTSQTTSTRSSSYIQTRSTCCCAGRPTSARVTSETSTTWLMSYKRPRRPYASTTIQTRALRFCLNHLPLKTFSLLPTLTIQMGLIGTTSRPYQVWSWLESDRPGGSLKFLSLRPPTVRRLVHVNIDKQQSGPQGHEGVHWVPFASAQVLHCPLPLRIQH